VVKSIAEEFNDKIFCWCKFGHGSIFCRAWALTHADETLKSRQGVEALPYISHQQSLW